MQWNEVTKRMAFGLGLVLLLSGQTVPAAETAVRQTQSVEGPAAEQASDLSVQLEIAPILEEPALETGGSRQERATQQKLMAHPMGRVFSIFDAQSVLSRDDDGDGYYHRLKVSFDADVESGTAWVYAKLYLSLEGGPWNHYFTTDVFSIEDDFSDDAYNVVTRLLDGYPTGYYDVLIELYDADFDLLVVNYGPFEDRDLAVLPLEDFHRDDFHDGGGGAVGPAILLLAVLAVVRVSGLQRRAGNLRS